MSAVDRHVYIKWSHEGEAIQTLERHATEDEIRAALIDLVITEKATIHDITDLTGKSVFDDFSETLELIEPS